VNASVCCRRDQAVSVPEIKASAVCKQIRAGKKAGIRQQGREARTDRHEGQARPVQAGMGRSRMYQAPEIGASTRGAR